MTSLPKKAQMVRDKEASRWLSSRDSFGVENKYSCPTDHYCMGFNQGYLEAMKRVEPLLAALEHLASDQERLDELTPMALKNVILSDIDEAREALLTFKKDEE
jgi:hypothetical protein